MAHLSDPYLWRGASLFLTSVLAFEHEDEHEDEHDNNP
jgi:hypothetical protein